MGEFHLVEIAVNELLQGMGEWLRAPFLAITFLGDEEFFILLFAALYWCFSQTIAVRTVIMLLLANALNGFLKFTFQTPRPYWISEEVAAYSAESSFGLPSGHSLIPASVWGWLAVEVHRRWFTVVALAIIFLIGASRIYLGVHFASDVLLGWLLGGVLVLVAYQLRRTVSDRLSAMTPAGRIGVVFVVAAVLVLMILAVRWTAADWMLPAQWAERAGDVDPFSLDGTFTFAGAWIGTLTGYVLLTTRRGTFLASGGGWNRVTRFLLGIVGVAILWFGLGQLFPREANVVSYALRVVRYAVTGLWVTWLAPLLFEKIGILEFGGGQGSRHGANRHV